MSKTLVILLYLVSSLGLIGSSGVRAATSYDGGYVSVGVPDLPQATSFFQAVLDCDLISPAAAPSDAVPVSVLLSCNQNSVVELFVERGNSPSPKSEGMTQPLQFISDNVQQAGKWLQQRGVTVSGTPRRLTSGPLAGHIVLDFTSPWGLRLQLLGRNTGESDGGGTVATTDAQYDRH